MQPTAQPAAAPDAAQLHVPTSLTWTPVANSGTVKFVTVLSSGQIVGIGTSNRIYTRRRLLNPWEGPVSSGLLKSISEFPNNLLIGTGMDNLLWFSLPLGANWNQVPNSGLITCVAALPNGSFIGVGLQGNIWTRDTFTSSHWQPYDTQPPVPALTVTVLAGGRWACVGTDNQLYLRIKGIHKMEWLKIPSVITLTSVSSLISGTLLASGTDTNLYTAPLADLDDILAAAQEAAA